MYCIFFFFFLLEVCELIMCVTEKSVSQARDVRTNEVVAIKKMSYSGKQSNEVRKDWL